MRTRWFGESVGVVDALRKKKTAREKKSPADATVRVLPTAFMKTYVRAMQERLREKKLGAKKEFLREIVKEVRVRDKTIQLTNKLPLGPRTSPSQAKSSRDVKRFSAQPGLTKSAYSRKLVRTLS
jgi:hypothetical protein